MPSRLLWLRVVSVLGPGSRMSLRDFTGAGYDKGRSLVVQLPWMMAWHWLTSPWWCPNSLRVKVLRAVGARIGDGVLVRHNAKIHWPWKLEIGDYSWRGEEAWILNLENVSIGSNSCISQQALICTGSHDRYSPTFEFDNADNHRQLRVGGDPRDGAAWRRHRRRCRDRRPCPRCPGRASERHRLRPRAI